MAYRYSRSTDGLALGVLIIIVLVIVVLAALIPNNYPKAERLAAEYISKQFPNHIAHNLECQHSDSDGDGYASCSVSLYKKSDKNREGDPLIPELECPCGWIQFNKDMCRIPKAHLRK